jgi:accessory colonization factor AcfC
MAERGSIEEAVAARLNEVVLIQELLANIVIFSGRSAAAATALRQVVDNEHLDSD